MKNNSIWNEVKEYKINSENISNVDVLIIGGGITGVLAAYFLKDSKNKVAILDKGKIGRGVTTNSTAKVSFIQKDIYQKLNKKFNFDTANLYLKSQVEATQIIVKLCKENNIECDLEEVKSFLFANSSRGIAKLHKEIEILDSMGIKSKAAHLPINFPYKQAYYVENTYVFHPLKFIYGILDIIKSKINIMEETAVLEVKNEDDNYIVFTNTGNIKAKKIIIACHYPFFIKPGFVPLKNHIEREYLNSSKYKCDTNFAAINMEQKTHSIRFYKDNIIYVSNNHRLTNKIDYDKNYEKSKEDFKKYFNKDPEYTWANQDLFTTDSLPLIGSLNDDNSLLIATGYNSWGMTNGVIAAKVVSDLCLGKNSIYKDLFNPQRFNLSMLISGTFNGLLYAKSYIESAIYDDKVTYTKVIDGKKYNVYKDKEGIEHVVNRKCPHMKCNVIFNKEDLTWDCPCHGSRFDIDGNVVEGPAKYSIKKK